MGQAAGNRWLGCCQTSHLLCDAIASEGFIVEGRLLVLKLHGVESLTQLFSCSVLIPTWSISRLLFDILKCWRNPACVDPNRDIFLLGTINDPVQCSSNGVRL